MVRVVESPVSLLVWPDPSFQYIIMNLAISNDRGEVGLENLQFPTYMSVDYARV
jgi:hypothetical protein